MDKIHYLRRQIIIGSNNNKQQQQKKLESEQPQFILKEKNATTSDLDSHAIPDMNLSHRLIQKSTTEVIPSSSKVRHASLEYKGSSSNTSPRQTKRVTKATIMRNIIYTKRK